MRTILKYFLAAMLLTTLSALPVMAQEADDPGDAPAPAFSNPTQSSIAEGLAAAATEKADAELADATTNLEAADDARNTAVANAAANPDDTALQEEAAKAQQAYEEAYDAFTAAAAAADVDVTSADIAGMRDLGMGWGQIAQELGVHPSTIGQSVANRNRAMNSFGNAYGLTTRNTATGKSSDAASASSGKGDKRQF